MHRDEHDLEKYLTEFRPRAVRPLRVSQRVSHFWLAGLAAAAVVLLGVGFGLWYAGHDRLSPPELKEQRVQVEFHLNRTRLTNMELTRLALEDEKQFQAQLESESRQVLPDFTQQQSTLRILAKE
ncbi:MAG TPA: hypothetical protein VEI54_10290 [Candidatus Limnocylindrales bacterium]|nr:hypothetical protein [Candidatus Limnocylindrales bacterium]